MAKNELVENAKQLELKVNELMERVKQLHADVGASLQQAKRHESKLIEKERAEAKARAEREKAERLKEFLESEEQKGVYFGGSDDDNTEAKTPVKDAEPKPDTSAEVKPAAEQTPEVGGKEPEKAPAESKPADTGRTGRPGADQRGDRPDPVP